VQGFTFTLPKGPSKLFLKLAPTANDSDLYNLSLKSVEINKYSQDITEGVIHRGQSVPFNSSIVKGITQVIDIGNYLKSLENQTNIYGGKGIDLFDLTSFSGSLSSIKYDDLLKMVKLDLATNNTHIFVTGHDVERVHLTNNNIALDINGNAGTIVKILGAVAGKQSLANKEYVGVGLDLLDKGMSYSELGALALKAVGLTTSDQIVTTLWTNIVGSAPSAAEKAPFIEMLENGFSRGEFVKLAAETPLNSTNIGLVGLAQTGIDYIPVG
jgi:hypothetical protein